MIKKVRTDDIKIGMYVIIPGSWLNHPFSLNQFKIKNKKQIKEIKSCGFHQIEVDFDKSDLPADPPSRNPAQASTLREAGQSTHEDIDPPAKWNPETLVPPGLIAAIEDKTLDTNTKAKAVYENSMDLMSRLLESPTAENITASKGAIKSVTDLILKDDETAHNLLLITTHDFYTYAHSVNVGIYSVMLAKELFRHSDNHDLEELGAGFFLHDLGKVNVDPAIINKPGRLTDDEMNQMRTHPYQGYKILKAANELSEECEYIVLQHHERYDGTGYPKHLKEEETHIYGRICCLADVFDALTAERSYKKPMSKFDALKLMRDEMPNFFSKDLLEPFILLFR
jgi:HD-GYP domain-containing protein (c-di-GMP phosphodiesterase class II)